MADKIYNIRQTSSGSILIGTDANQQAGDYFEITQQGLVIEYIAGVPQPLSLKSTLTNHLESQFLHLDSDLHAALLNTTLELSPTNPVIDSTSFGEVILQVMEVIALVLTENQKKALDGSDSPSELNVYITASVLQSHASDYKLHMGTDQNAAFDNANAPKGTNPLATMNDIPSPPAPPPEFAIPTIIDGSIGTKPTALQCETAFADVSTNVIRLMKSVTAGWLVTSVVTGTSTRYFYEKLTRAV